MWKPEGRFERYDLEGAKQRRRELLREVQAERLVQESVRVSRASKPVHSQVAWYDTLLVQIGRYLIILGTRLQSRAQIIPSEVKA